MELKEPINEEGDDYINASWINGQIAAQGPMPHTTPHFLQMLIEQKIQVLIMLTKTQEVLKDGKYYITSKCISLHISITGSVNVLCDQYWPKKVGTSQTFDYIEVHNVDEEDFVAGQVVLRYLNLKSKFALENSMKKIMNLFFFFFRYEEW